MISFEGVVPALITPMTPDGAVNEEALRQVMEFNIQAGVQGFWVAGGSGESILLDDAENRRIADIACDQTQGRAFSIMHVGAATTLRAARLAEHAAQAGCEAICCVPPFFYQREDDAIVEHYRVVAAAADLPFFVYNVPQFTGKEILVDLMKRFRDAIPQLTGLKHSAPNLPLVHDFAEMGLACLVGNSTLMLPALTLGATGCVDGPPNAAPEPWVALWRAFRQGDLGQAMEAQRQATAVTELARSCGPKFHSVAKAILSARLGIDCGSARAPGLPLTPDEHRRVMAGMRALGLDRP